MRLVGFAIALATCAACASTHGVSNYRAPSLTIAAVPPAVCDAITRLARAEGWEIVTVSPEQGVVEAVSSVDNTLGIGMRERWLFTVADYDVAVTRKLEVQFKPGESWSTEDRVANGYAYEREHQVLSSLGAQFSLTIPRY